MVAGGYSNDSGVAVIAVFVCLLAEELPSEGAAAGGQCASAQGSGENQTRGLHCCAC